MPPLSAEFEEVAEPRSGSALPVVGFVLADSFDDILRQLSIEYVEAAWRRLEAELARHAVLAKDLSWGWLHPGVTRVPGVYDRVPSSFTGWTSQVLLHQRFEDDPRCQLLDRELRDGSPALACAGAWRSSRWRIPPDDFATGLRLIREMWLEESTDWVPSFMLDAERPEHTIGRWAELARALLDEDQAGVDAAVADARATYSPAGFELLIVGFRQYLNETVPGQKATVRLPG